MKKDSSQWGYRPYNAFSAIEHILFGIIAAICISASQGYAEPITGFNYLDLSLSKISIGRDFRSNRGDIKNNHYNLSTSTKNIIASYRFEGMKLSPEISAAMILEYEESITDMQLHQMWINQHHNQQKSRQGSKALNYLLRKSVLRWWMARGNSDSIDLKLLKVDREGNLGNDYSTGLRYDISVGTGGGLSPDKVDFNIEYEF